MPKRTNVFQEIVTIIHEHMAGDAHVERSGSLRHRVTGRKREVDAVIRSIVAGHELIISVEAKAVEEPATARPADVGWVEKCIEKHRNLPTSKLVLVSESGFTKDARKQAEHEKAVALTPEVLDATDPRYAVMAALPSLWPKQVKLEAEKATLIVRRPDGTLVRVKDVDTDLELFLADGESIGSLVGVFKALCEQNMPTIIQGIAGISEETDTSFTVGSGSPWLVEVEGEEVNLYVSWEEADPRELQQIERGEFTGKATIRVREIPLQHKRLGEITMAYGEGPLADRPLLMVVTYDETGGKVTIRERPGTTRSG